MDTDRNLLFAVLALQADLIDRERFIPACTLWAAHKDVPIADLLVEQGWLTPAHRGVVEQLIEAKLGKHGGDVQASLAETTSPEARGALAAMADADVERSLAALTGPYLRGAAADTDLTTLAGGAGRNLLFEEIGHGGMGRVLRGRDPGLRRELAVKVLRDAYRGNLEVERRFVEEAQIGGQLQHPGVVPVYELGHFADRRPFFTMKLVKGRTLADLLRERPDPGHDLPRFLGVFEQACQTVAYAHSKGVVHRDLKPRNVMVGAFGEVQVMDWGLAKVLSPPRGEGPERTAGAGTLIRTARSDSTAEEEGRTGVVGTPAYMAPEQARGEAGAVDERADVFGLGAILCEILTGRPPHTGPDSEQVMRRAAAGELTGAFDRLNRCGADAELVALCEACLAPAREGRPRDAGAAAARMAAYQAAVQERLRRAELERAAAEARAVEERKRRRVSLALAAAVLSLVAVGAGGWVWIQQQAAARRQLVESALDKAQVLREQLRFREAATMLEQGRQALGKGGPGDLRQRLDVAEAELALVNRLDAIRQRRATIVESKFDTRTAARDYAAAFREAGLGEVGDSEDVVAERVRASGVRGTLVAALDDWTLVTGEPESRSWLLGVARRADRDRWGDRFRDPAVWQDRQALQALAEDALQDDGAKLDELSPQVLVALAWRLGGEADAMPLLRTAQRRYPSDFWLSLGLGNALYRTKRWEKAVGYFRVAVALRPEAAAAHNNLGNALADTKDLDGAVAEFRTALVLDPKNAIAHINLGHALHDKKNRDGAIDEYRKAIDLDPKLAQAHYSLGIELYAKNDVAGAIAKYQQAIDCDPGYARAHNNLGVALLAKGNVHGAIDEFHKALDLDPVNAAAHTNLGRALAAKGDVGGAIDEYRKAIDCDAKLANAHFNLGNALRAKGDVKGAIDAYKKAIDCDPKFAPAHYNLGLALAARQDWTGASVAFRQAADLDPRHVYAPVALGHALLEQGRFGEARTATLRGLELLPERDPVRQRTSQQLQQCERLAALDDKKVSAVLSGEAEPADAAERLALAQLCQLHYQRRHAAAARFYADAFAADPRLAADLQQQHRYNAACNAALAAAGQGEDAKHLPDKARLMLRRQALAWLRDDLAAYARMAQGAEPAGKQLVRERMRHWQQDSDLGSVRDPRALDRLSADERRPWQQLWQDVGSLLKKVEEKK
jgi:serine/threonine-protein kinase